MNNKEKKVIIPRINRFGHYDMITPITPKSPKWVLEDPSKALGRRKNYYCPPTRKAVLDWLNTIETKKECKK